MADILHTRKIIYPLGAGVVSAIGFLTAPLSLDYIRSSPGPLDGLEWDDVNRIFSEMEVQGREALSRSIPPAQVSFRRYGEMHYRRQGYEIRVPIPLGELGPESVTEIKANFEGVYREQYGHIMPDTPIDVVSWRVIAQGPKPDLILPSARPRSGGAREAKKGSRYIYLPLTKDFGQVPVYDRYALGAGQSLNGPAVIEERESTVVINGPAKIEVDKANNLMVELESGAGE